MFQVIAVYQRPPGPPLYQQYWEYLREILFHGSLGETYNRQSLTHVVLQFLPVTAAVVFGGAIVWLTLSIPLGILSAVRPRSLFDRGVLAVTLVALCVHPIVISLFFSYLFGFRLGWLPIQGYCHPFSPP